MKIKGVIIAFLFLYLTTPFLAFASPQTDSLLQELTHTIETKANYIQLKQLRIAQMKASLEKENLALPAQYDLNNKLYQEYRSYQYDEAFTYSLQLKRLADKMQDPVRVTHSQLNHSFILLSAGLFKEAFDALEEVSVANKPDSIRIEYYSQMARAYLDLASYNKDPHFSAQYARKGGLYLDSAIVLTNQNEMQYYTLKGGKFNADADYEGVKQQLHTVLARFRPGYHQYAMAAHSLGNAYEALGDRDEAILMLARAAIADIKSSTTEAMALMRLAELLYNSGDEARAYYYIKQALEDAEFYGARLRKMQVAAILPVIEGERLATVESQRSKLFNYAVALSLLALLVVMFAYVIFRQLRQLRKAKQNLTDANSSLQQANSKLKDINDVLQETNEALLEANKIKEEYIGHSFNMYTDYLDKIEKLKVAVDKKLRQKQYGEIAKVMDSVSLKAERESLYQSFDGIFLKLFPNFVDALNTFFKPEDRYELPDDKSLNVELRIFALIRIGISDHEQIARIMEYSVRTVYNYKTKVKNRSILSNEEFEQRVMEIKTI